MPFVVGIITNCLQEVLTLPMEEVLIIDVDNDRFLKKPASVYEYNLLPDQYWTPVIKAIKNASKNLISLFFFYILFIFIYFILFYFILFYLFFIFIFFFFFHFFVVFFLFFYLFFFYYFFLLFFILFYFKLLFFLFYFLFSIYFIYF